MSENAVTVVRKIKENIFMATDVLFIEIVIEKLTPITMKPDTFFEKYPEVIDDLEGILVQGSTWEFNPTNKLLHASGSTSFAIDKEKLSSYMKEKAIFETKELDVNNNVTIMKVPVELLIKNARLLTTEMIEKSSYHVVSTLFGKVEL